MEKRDMGKKDIGENKMTGKGIGNLGTKNPPFEQAEQSDAAATNAAAAGRLTRLTKLMLDVMYYGGFIVTVTLPFSFRWYGQFNERFVRFYRPLVLLFFACGILAILIIGNLRKMFQTVLCGDCFVDENVESLKKMGTYSFLIAALTCLRLLMYITPSVLVIILVFTIAGAFSKVLAGVFETAVNYKKENDLTI